MQIATGERSAGADPLARTILDNLKDREADLGLQRAYIFFDFPLYRDDERLVECQFLLVSENYGIVLAGVSGAQRDAAAQIKAAETALDAAYSQLMSRLIKNPALRQGRATLKVPFDGFLFAPDLERSETSTLETFSVIRSTQELYDFFESARAESIIPESVVAETLATIEGAKGLLRPKEREVATHGENSKAALATRLEEEINRFDRDQVEGYVTRLDGVQRIRGLAGSGKTVVLAMRAAQLLLREPDARIAFTFYTKSLYQHVRRLITRFYRQYDDQDPDWEKLNVLHAWGGRANPGVYFNACLNAGTPPLTYTHAASVAGIKSPFDAACSLLLKSSRIAPTYDYVLVDEAQDFPPSFLRLCHSLAKQGRLVYAYDQLQTIFQAKPPTVTEVFGTDEDGDPTVDLEADIVLHKCYRNPLEITVCAHAMGFGIYGDRIVQMLENEEHWRDLGYEVLTGPLIPGGLTRIKRLPTASPSSISALSGTEDIVAANVYSNLQEEIGRVVENVEVCIRQQGLRPDDVLIVCADDRNARMYLSAIAAGLEQRGIATNNLQVDTYSLQDFVREKSVTLSTIHKAKGNEAYQVFIVGIDALFRPITVRNRNMVFTAMTRAKAWLHVSGVGQFAQVFKRELDEAIRHLPNLEFRYPSAQDLQVMQRDLRESAEQRADKLLRELRELIPEEDVRRLVQQRLELPERPRSRARGPRGDRKK
ncbi:MAG: DEAD/DEAH box helicase [Steroidobacteraceae bacterium]